MTTAGRDGLGWPGIVRIGLVQAAIGSMVVLMTSTLNRVMVVEYALPAAVPGALVALHFGVQLLRVRMGFGSDRSRSRTPWIIGGMALLSCSAVGASAGTALLGQHRALGLAVCAVSFLLLGIGVSAAGTPLLALLAEGVAGSRRGPAAAAVWLTMIAGFIVTTAVVGSVLDPFTPLRLVAVTAAVAMVGLLLTSMALHGLERTVRQLRPAHAAAPEAGFRQALADLWADAPARRFAVFVFLAMLAYSAQDLILEPFAGTVFGFTPGESTRVSSLQNGGLLIGMIGTAVLSARVGQLPRWAAAGCVASAAGCAALVGAGLSGTAMALKGAVFLLGASNGVFAVGAIGGMMALAGRGQHGGAGMRMGLWGSAQAIAYGLGGFAGAALSDVAQAVTGSPLLGYTIVFGGEAALFLAAGMLARRASAPHAADAAPLTRNGDALMAVMG